MAMSEDAALRALTALRDATRLVAASTRRDLDAVLDAVADEARRLLGADAAALQLADPETGDLVVRRPNPLAAPDSSLAVAGTRYRPGGFTREAVRLRKPLFSPDFQSDPRHDAARKSEFTGVVASLVVPLLAGEDLVGTLYLDWTRPHVLEPADLVVAEAFGQQAATAIRMARSLEAEQAARLAAAGSEARFRQLAESIGAVFYIAEADFSRLYYVSPGYRTIWGRSPEELYANPGAWLDAIHPEDRAPVALALTTQPAGRYEAQYRVVRPDGTVRWVDDRAYPMADPETGRVRNAGLAVDVTDRHVAEEALRAAAAEQARLDGSIKTARSVAHLINNELVLLTGYADLLPRMAQADAAAAAQRMATAAYAVAHLVERLQQIVRFEETDMGIGPMLDLAAAAPEEPPGDGGDSPPPPGP